MGLGSISGDITEKQAEAKATSGDTGSSSNSSDKSSNGDTGNGSSSSNFPKYERRQPQMVLEESNGEYKLVKYPDTTVIEFIKNWHSAPWEPADFLPGEWKEVWWSEEALKLDQHKVEKELGLDLMGLLKGQPERATEALREARLSYSSDSNTSEAVKQRPCAVCDAVIRLYHDDYEDIGNRIVCTSHNVAELSSAGLLE